MLTIHGRATSSNVQIVMWAIAELQLKHTRLDVGAAFGGNDTPEYLAMNPNGLVPVLQDGDVTLFESAAIVRYLGARYGDEIFWPRDPGVRGMLDMWAEWAKSTLVPAMVPLFMQFVRTPERSRDAAVISAATAELGNAALIADQRIGKGPFLGGEHLTFADIVFAQMLYRFFTLPIERPDTPNLAAYYERLSKRPAFAEHSMVSYESLMIR